MKLYRPFSVLVGFALFAGLTLLLASKGAASGGDPASPAVGAAQLPVGLHIPQRPELEHTALWIVTRKGRALAHSLKNAVARGDIILTPDVAARLKSFDYSSLQLTTVAPSSSSGSATTKCTCAWTWNDANSPTMIVDSACTVHGRLLGF